MYLVDTNIFIDFSRGKLPNVYSLFKQEDPSMFKVSAVTVAELYLGAYKSDCTNQNILKIEKTLAPFEVIPFDSNCAMNYAIVRSELEKRGKVIGGNDMMIAATALTHNLTLMTQNYKEFFRVRHLRVETYHDPN